MMSQREGAVCPVRPSFTPVDSPSQTNWFAKVQAASPACFAYRTLPGDTIKSGQANRGAQRGLAGSKSKLHTPSPQSGLKGHCVSGKIVAGYNPLLKVTIFQQHLTHTYTQIETGEGERNWGLHRIVYCACKIYVLWSPAINTHCFSIKVHINPLILPPLEISLFSAWQTGATETFVHLFCSFPIFSFLVASSLVWFCFLSYSWCCYCWYVATELYSQ